MVIAAMKNVIKGSLPLFSTTIMRAIVVSEFGDPHVLDVRRDVPIPKPEANQILVQVAAIGVNPVETYIRSGKYTRLPQLPYTPGNDFSGTIAFVGAETKGFKVGDKVCSLKSISGAYAEYSIAAPEHLIKLPEKCDLVKAAAVGTPYVTAYRALFIVGKMVPGESVLIHGASGGVGIAACQLATHRGIKVFGTAGTKEGMSMLKSLGVEHVYNHRADGYTRDIMRDSGGVNGVIEMLSNVNLGKDLPMLKKNGRVMVVGCRGPVEINPRAMMANETSIHGVAMAASTKEELAETTSMISTGLVQGWLDPVIGVKYSLNNARKAHEDIINTTGANGKVILVV